MERKGCLLKMETVNFSSLSELEKATLGAVIGAITGNSVFKEFLVVKKEIGGYTYYVIHGGREKKDFSCLLAAFCVDDEGLRVTYSGEYLGRRIKKIEEEIRLALKRKVWKMEFEGC